MQVFGSGKMPDIAEAKRKKISPSSLAQMKLDGVKIVCLTAYDSLMASLYGGLVDVMLVGDSMGMVRHGFATTHHVDIDMMELHVASCARAKGTALLVGDLPFGSIELGPEQAITNAVRLIRAGADAVKIEGGIKRQDVIQAVVNAGIPVMGHVGLEPQHILMTQSFRSVGKNDGEVQSVVADALAVENAGAFAVVVEAVRLDLSTQLEAAVKIPTIGIGAGPLCDGQILVAEDMLGFFEGNPKFVRRYAELGHLVQEAVTRYADDVRSGAFPSEKESYQ